MRVRSQEAARPHGRADRLVLALALVLVIGTPAFVAFYWFDRHPAAGPSLNDRTIASAEAAVRDQPNDLAARNRLAAAYVSAGRYDDAIAQFGEVLKAAPDSRAALLGRGIAFLRAGNQERARTDFQALIDRATGEEMAHVDPQLEQAYYEIGVIDLEQGRPADAVSALERALQIDSGDADALYSYGSALIAAGDAEKGVTALRRAVAFVPTGWCEPYARMVEGYRATRQVDGVAYANGMLEFCNGRPADAIAALQAIRAAPFAQDAWLGLAVIAASQGDRAAAVDYYERVLAADPENPSALIGLSQIGGGDAHPVASAPAASQEPAP